MNTANKPSDYKHIVAWGHMMHSYLYYIEDQKELACATGAPINAIYQQHARDGSGPTGVWVTADQIQSKDTRERIEREVAAMLGTKPAAPA